MSEGPHEFLNRRIRVCVNACDKISTEALEDNVVEEMVGALGELTEVAKEMLIKNEICQLPMCGEARGHVGWCRILLAQECLTKVRP